MVRVLRAILLLAAVAGLTVWLQPAPADLVVYCAHDSVYAAPFLREFTADTGITLDVRYDTEATKSLGLTELIDRERAQPRCDVFWNNEALGTQRLAAAGLLVPYKGSGYQRIPARYKDPAGRWVGFAARLRVWIVHQATVPARRRAIAAHMARPSLAGVAIAKPLYGTTRTHFTAMWDQLGEQKARAWFRDVRSRGIRIVNGNAQVKNLVAHGQCAIGLTDTDDFFVAKDAGLPVAMLPATLADGSTICIPNTAGIVKGCRNLAAAQRLVDYLASAAAERRLANSRSRQIPLGPVEESLLPEEVRALLPAARQGYRFADVNTASASCLRWLKSL